MGGDPMEAQFLGFLLKTMNAKKVIEVGAFRGSTTLTFAQSLPEDGKVVCLDITDKYFLKDFWKEAGVEHKIDLRVAPASESMQKMVETPAELDTYDLVFIDAEKTGYDGYYEMALKLLKPGGVVAIDNTLWGGRITDTEDLSDDTKSLQALNLKCKADERVDVIMLTIGDGCTLCRKR